MSDENSQSGEKTHEPTPQRLEQARKRGDVAKSDEVTTVAVYLGLIVGGYITLGSLADHAGLGLVAFLDRVDGLEGRILGPGGTGLALSIVGLSLAGLAPLIALPLVFALGSLIAQRGIAPSGQKLVPKLSRLSLVAGFKNKFGPTGLVEFVKRVVKLSAVAAIVFYIAAQNYTQVLGSPAGVPAAQVRLMFQLLAQLLISVTVVACAIAAIDLAWVQFDHRRKLRMTHQELKDETKESEGDPMLKGKRRRKAIDIATGQMLTDVGKADVMIVNPTHYAVALVWSREAGTAPTCVAKGVDEIAARMREIADVHNVPVHRDPPTARTLHAMVEVGAEIPADQYRAVAAAIRFADAVRKKSRERHGPTQ